MVFEDFEKFFDRQVADGLSGGVARNTEINKNLFYLSKGTLINNDIVWVTETFFRKDIKPKFYQLLIDGYVVFDTVAVIPRFVRKDTLDLITTLRASQENEFGVNDATQEDFNIPVDSVERSSGESFADVTEKVLQVDLEPVLVSSDEVVETETQVVEEADVVVVTEEVVTEAPKKKGKKS